jgi:hypothetical protein
LALLQEARPLYRRFAKVAIAADHAVDLDLELRRRKGRLAPGDEKTPHGLATARG